uniref:Hypothetical conserved protein n=1 Tax=Acetithermum autotrophicum TaxID=1446466 RepID=H5STH0_ACEAU|nr:hypothetical conserved protein [Candidatus Acetothermum autotrophicum]
MKVRVQIYLEPRQDRALEELAKVRGVSKARLIRDSIDYYLKEAIPYDQDPAVKLIGLAGKTGYRDLAERHDGYLIKFERSGKPKRHARSRDLR